MEIYGGTSLRFAVGFQTGATNTYSSAGDGLPDWWKLKYGLDPNGPASVNGPAADPDGDGRSNLLEYLFGTNPLVADVNAGSLLTQTRDSQGRISLSFPTLKNRFYRVLESDSLTAPFQAITGDFLGTGSPAIFTDPNSGPGFPRRFYRLEARTP